MAMIEIMGNPIQQWEQQQEAQEAEELGRADFWEWELKLLKQEQQYFKNHLDKLQDQIEDEIEAASTDALDEDELRSKSEKKFGKQKHFLLQSLRRAIIEEEIHLKQKGDRRYRALNQKYRSSPVWDMNDLGRNARQAVANWLIIYLKFKFCFLILTFLLIRFLLIYQNLIWKIKLIKHVQCEKTKTKLHSFWSKGKFG